MDSRRKMPALAAGAVLFLSALQAAAQMPEFPMGGFPFGDLSPEKMMSMTPEDREAAVEDMMIEFGVKMGLDEAALRAATPEQRQEMLRSGAAAIRERMEQSLEQRFGRPIEELENMSEDQLRTLVASRAAAATDDPADAAPRLRPEPLGGFPDGSEPLPVTADYVAELSVSEPAGRQMILVVADAVRREILWRSERMPPFNESLDLSDISSRLSNLVVELIDPETRRVARRLRPVAANP